MLLLRSALLASLLTIGIGGCIESNPQPSPYGNDQANQGRDTEERLDPEDANVSSDYVADMHAPDWKDADQVAASDSGETMELVDEDACIPDCEGRECGPDGCGGECGTCWNACRPCGHPPGGQEYLPCSENGKCPMVCCPLCCDGRQCGSDGCGGVCGVCPQGELCGSDAQCYPESCVPQCDGKECGPDGCGNSCGFCPNGAGCSPYGVCPGNYVPMSVQCAHVPYLLTGQTPLAIPIAVGALVGGCDAYHHALATIDGSTIHVSLMATPDPDPCPPCIYSYVGIVWVYLDLAPGQYTMYVGDDPTPHPFLVSYGDITAPSCDEGCPSIPTDGWLFSVNLPKAGHPVPSCSLPRTAPAQVELSGSCQNWDASVTVAGLTSNASLHMCDENLLFLGAEGSWEPSATHCILPGDGDGQEVHWILGIDQHPLALGPEPTLFLWESE